ncbi:MAG: hypothetical protein IK079_05035, partial [Desulfovibrio sp.]|nr:hypothetical protein [Desulfovibrio sp.]
RSKIQQERQKIPLKVHPTSSPLKDGLLQRFVIKPTKMEDSVGLKKTLCTTNEEFRTHSYTSVHAFVASLSSGQ